MGMCFTALQQLEVMRIGGVEVGVSEGKDGLETGGGDEEGEVEGGKVGKEGEN